MPATEELTKHSVKSWLTLPGRDHPLVVGEQSIGRSPECDLMIDDPLISRQHARIWWDGNAAIFEDLGSRNGSRVNGQLVRQRTQLEHGDRVQVGSREMIFNQDSQYSEMRIPLARRSEGPPSMDDVPELESGSWAIQEQITLIAWVDPGQEESSVRWPLQMLVELLGKAMLSERHRDVAGLMEQAAISLNRALEAGESLKVSDLSALHDAAKWLQKVQHTDRWVRLISEAQRCAGHSTRRGRDARRDTAAPGPQGKAGDRGPVSKGRPGRS
jgi:hypothetical protein